MQPGGEPGCYFSSFSIEYPIDYAAVGIVYPFVRSKSM